MQTYEQWVITEQRLHNLPALVNTKTKELCIFGTYGEIYEYATDKIGIILYKQTPTMKRHIQENELLILVRPKSDIGLWSKLIKTSYWPSNQLKLVKRSYK